jgi:hypothetical protein
VVQVKRIGVDEGNGGRRAEEGAPSDAGNSQGANDMRRRQQAPGSTSSTW